MSKHIWRGRTWRRIHGMRKLYEVWRTEWPADETCTVVEDAACFPVKEAMALCREVEKEQRVGACVHSFGYVEARRKYLRAVERMRKKAVKK